MLTVSNEAFLHGIFGENWPYAHVTSFPDDPTGIGTEDRARCWRGNYYSRTSLAPGNQYYTISVFSPDETGKARRRKPLFLATYVVVADDVKEKLPIDQVQRLPPPSYILETSPGSEQWGWVLTHPETNRHRVENLLDGLVRQGLAPDGKDPGMKGVTRYVRLPEGTNTKANRVQANGGTAPACRLLLWEPGRKTTVEDLAAPFGIDLDAERRLVSDGASDLPDHPLLHTGAVHIKKAVGNGRYDITCPWIDEHTGQADDGAAVFTNADGSIGFKCHHGSCQDRTGKDLLEWCEAQQPGFNDRLRTWQALRDLATVGTVSAGAAPATLLTGDAAASPLARLRSMTADGAELLKQMAEDRFLFKDLAIMGQWTVFYAAPNSGKTLLTQWLLREAIDAGMVKGEDVFYVNVDDTAKAGAEKAQMATEFGYQMLLSSVKGFRARDLLGLIDGMSANGEANGKVLILDTLKKFTDLMDKRLSSDFGNTARSFVAAGGTLVCLAHVNKHKVDGHSVYAGTSDIRDDADGVFVIESVGSFGNGLGDQTHTVEFRCSKSRGDVAQSVSFQFTKAKGGDYRDMFDSIQRVDPIAARLQAEAETSREKDAELIELIQAAFENGVDTKGEIINFVMTTSDASRRAVRRVLETYTGRLWDIERGMHNRYRYSPKKAPQPPLRLISFL